MMNVETISERLIALGGVVGTARAFVANDDEASDALRTAVHDLAERHREVQDRSKQTDPRVARELVHLLEAVADRARHEALEADGISDSTREAVVEAHERIAALAGEVEAPAWRT